MVWSNDLILIFKVYNQGYFSGYGSKIMFKDMDYDYGLMLWFKKSVCE
jgi:hypothetical protein